MFQNMLNVRKNKEEDAVSYNALTLWAQIGWPVAIPLAVTTGILLPRSEQPVQMRQLCAGGSNDIG